MDSFETTAFDEQHRFRHAIIAGGGSLRMWLALRLSLAGAD